MNMVTAMIPMIPRVAAALCAFGGRKAWTPSAMASTPVRALAPEAKARKISNSDTPATSGVSTAPDEMACGQASTAQRTRPVPRVMPTIATNR